VHYDAKNLIVELKCSVLPACKNNNIRWSLSICLLNEHVLLVKDDLVQEFKAWASLKCLHCSILLST